MSYFADQLKQLRLQRNLTQAALSKELGVTQNAIFNWENGKREPSMEMIQKIADYFQVSTAYLFAEKETYRTVLRFLDECSKGKTPDTIGSPRTNMDGSMEAISEAVKELRPDFVVKDETGTLLMTLEFTTTDKIKHTSRKETIMTPEEMKQSEQKSTQAIEKTLCERRPAEGKNFSSEERHVPVTYNCGQASQTTRQDCVREETAAYDAKREKRQGEYTIEDYYAWSEDERIELIDGVIYVMNAPGFVHQRIAGSIFSQLDACFHEKQGDCIPLISPIDVRLDCDDKTMVQPDLIILCDKNKIKRWGIMGAPDFILEILSPSTRRKDSIKKLQKYSDAGVREYWILDPEKKTLLTYDFTDDCLPRIYPLTGRAGLALYGGELQIDLDEIAGMIQDWPE